MRMIYRSADGPDNRADRQAGAADADLAQRCAALEQEVGQLRGMLEGVPHLLWRSCDKGNWTWASRQWMDYTGLAQGEGLGRGWLSAVHPDDRAHTMAAWDEVRPHGNLDVSFRTRRADGVYVWHRTRSLPVRDATGDIVAWLGSTTDIQDLRDHADRLEQEIARRREVERRLLFAAFHDDLTGLRSRAYFMDALASSIERTGRAPRRRSAVLFMDFDRFKLVNDSLGHQAGDDLLVEIAARLTACLEGADTLARFGGDEFAILLETDGLEKAVQRAVCINETMRRPVWLGRQEVFASCSIGIVEVADRHRRPEEVLRDADIAMYSAKSRHPGSYAVFTEAMRHDAIEALALRTDLRNAIDRREFVLRYQPICDSGTRQIVGMEALIRWFHPTRGQIRPSAFIGIAEETGCIGEIGHWVVRQACTELRDLSLRFPGLTLCMSINASGQELKDTSFARHVLETLTTAGLDPAWLQVEVTESVLLRQEAVVAETLRDLRALGIRVALDDFGTGYSSLSTLGSYEIDVIKIDQSFVSRMLTETRAGIIVRTVARLARDMDLTIVAEGVEHEAQLDMLRKAGCGLVQGYLVGRPMPADELAGAIADGVRDRPPS